MPRGPQLAWGSRNGVSSSVKGVYFGRPGLPRVTFASLSSSPSLGPPSGLGKAAPKQQSEQWKKRMKNYMIEQPVSFVLEGVMGHNMQDADSIRQLRRQLGHAEQFYQVEDHELKAEMSRLKLVLDRNEMELEEEESRRRKLEERIGQRRRELAAVQQMQEENVRELEELYELKRIVDSKSTKRDIFEFYMNPRRKGNLALSSTAGQDERGAGRRRLRAANSARRRLTCGAVFLYSVVSVILQDVEEGGRGTRTRRRENKEMETAIV
ncbi:hypothetical protein GUITHDRAFT_99203 [Guillardia theta CCMP2712]|uniref:Uncharacterized protein n=1 Tax=Guillardia theta (strain CCMP2712) TaxID=905079 RepID=L1K496_GUITC|nr:hypothetical protein GUITHDRAFT_99203 [Guillardia theta CCMP2712]EKX55424.1 hypothetical protein GUITHDRAFT_99203 [Guillardia theta CCMP2712]|eukprot:XP_005842404.1 hypothetical protein GUITHDRAFT_99203 [Guillardia theta CCMP2712]